MQLMLEQIEWLKSQISYLIGTVGTLDEFIKTDFATCSDNLATFEKKICQIAQAASAEEQVLFIDQVGELNKVFQNELFGEDCIDNVEVGCPVAGSVLSEITILDQRITTIEGNNNNASISDLQDQIDALTLIVTSIQADIAALDTRLTAAENGIISINTLITDIQTAITDLETRVTDIESSLSAHSDMYHIIKVCGDIAASGPIYEAILANNTHTTFVGYTATPSSKGLHVLAEAGITGDLYLRTTVNTRLCKFKVYDLTTELKMCWNNQNRRASENSIDTECDAANDIANPTANCTCVQ